MDADFFDPVSSLDPRYLLDMLCLFVANFAGERVFWV